MVGDIEKALEGVGLKAEAFEKIKLGRGVVGKSTYVALAGMLVLGAIALRTSSTLLLAATLCAVMILVVVYFAGVLWFASKNPGVSLLEGSELIQWRQMDMGIKGMSALPASPNIEPPAQIEGQ